MASILRRSIAPSSSFQEIQQPPPSAVSSIEATDGSRRNKPRDTKLRQQKLPAWQPILTASTVIPTIFGIGIVFLPIGVTLFLASQGGRYLS